MALIERIDKDGKRRWQVRIAVRDADGRRQNRTIGTYATKWEAQRTERDALAQHERGTLLKPDTTTVGLLLDEYLRVEMLRTVRPENRLPYESIIRNHLKPTLGSVQARRVASKALLRHCIHIAQQLRTLQSQ